MALAEASAPALTSQTAPEVRSPAEASFPSSRPEATQNRDNLGRKMMRMIKGPGKTLDKIRAIARAKRLSKINTQPHGSGDPIANEISARDSVGAERSTSQPTPDAPMPISLGNGDEQVVVENGVSRLAINPPEPSVSYPPGTTVDSKTGDFVEPPPPSGGSSDGDDTQSGAGDPIPSQSGATVRTWPDGRPSAPPSPEPPPRSQDPSSEAPMSQTEVEDVLHQLDVSLGAEMEFDKEFAKTYPTDEAKQKAAKDLVEQAIDDPQALAQLRLHARRHPAIRAELVKRIVVARNKEPGGSTKSTISEGKPLDLDNYKNALKNYQGDQKKVREAVGKPDANTALDDALWDKNPNYIKYLALYGRGQKQETAVRILAAKQPDAQAMAAVIIQNREAERRRQADDKKREEERKKEVDKKTAETMEERAKNAYEAEQDENRKNAAAAEARAKYAAELVNKDLSDTDLQDLVRQSENITEIQVVLDEKAKSDKTFGERLQKAREFRVGEKAEAERLASTTGVSKSQDAANRQEEGEVDITENTIDSDLAEILSDKDVDHLQAELGKKYKAKKGEEFSLSRPARKDAFEAAGLLSKKAEVQQLTREAIDLAKARGRYVRARAWQIAIQKGINIGEEMQKVKGTIEVANQQIARSQDSEARQQLQGELQRQTIELRSLARAQELVREIASGKRKIPDAFKGGELDAVVAKRKAQQDILQGKFEKIMGKIEGKNPDPENTFLRNLRDLPDLLQEYPDAGWVLAEASKKGANKKKLILMLVILTLGAMPIFDELKKMMQIQG